MNIFVTHTCPEICAQSLDNKRMVKMVLETAQILSTAIFINNPMGNYSYIYKPTHLKHPCTLWASLTSSNWQWLLKHFISLCHEYTWRYKKTHASYKILPYLTSYKEMIKEGPLTPFANCTRAEALKIDFKHMEDTHEAYRQYLSRKWQNDKHPPLWTHRNTPIWYKI